MNVDGQEQMDGSAERFGLKITSAQRLYFNYRFDRPSFEVEMAALSSARPRPSRDFRTRKERAEEERGRPFDVSNSP